MNRNESPRVSNKLYEILRELLNNKCLLENFSQEFCERIKSEDEGYSLNVVEIDSKYFFKGYPTGNLIRICTRILEIWNITGGFPINFIKIDGLKVINKYHIVFLTGSNRQSSRKIKLTNISP